MGKQKPLLTKRETQVLQLICKQYTNQDIANTLNLNVHTIDSFRENLLKKQNQKMLLAWLCMQ